MVQHRRLTDAQRWSIIGQLNVGERQTDVAVRYGVSQSVVSRLYQRYQQTGDVKERHGRGRPRSTSGRDDRYIEIQALRSRSLSAPAMRTRLRNVRNVNVSVQTVRNRLHERGLNAHRPVIATPLTRRHRQARLQWATAHQNWTRQRWSNVVFTDESRYNLSRADGRTRVWRRRGERYAQCNVLERDPYGGGSVMVWAGISHNFKTDLVVIDGTLTGQGYLDQVIDPHVVPFMRRNGGNFIFMDDNARPHRALVVTNRLRQAGIQSMDWPARSPDLNPIEHAWDELGRRLSRRLHQPTDLAELRTALVQEWNAMPQDVVRRLVMSMRRRCVACVTARGGHTRY